MLGIPGYAVISRFFAVIYTKFSVNFSIGMETNLTIRFKMSTENTTIPLLFLLNSPLRTGLIISIVNFTELKS